MNWTVVLAAAGLFVIIAADIKIGPTSWQKIPNDREIWLYFGIAMAVLLLLIAVFAIEAGIGWRKKLREIDALDKELSTSLLPNPDLIRWFGFPYALRGYDPKEVVKWQSKVADDLLRGFRSSVKPKFRRRWRGYATDVVDPFVGELCD